jgi:predicted TIM-barrel fold metal-dependent hydrolase
MPVDADAHIDESDETWEYFDEAGKRFKPLTVIQDGEDPTGRTPKGYNRYWMFDGFPRVRRHRDDKRTGTVVETRELYDVPRRTKHMTELGVDIQIAYPTALLDTVTLRPDAELALYKSYNRWMAAKWKLSDNRIRWAAMAPMLATGEVEKELEFCKANGACGVVKRGLEYDNRSAADTFFHPMYKAAERLNLPICFHVGRGMMARPALNRDGMGIATSLLPVIDAFNALAERHIPAMFPKLRWGFIEATSAWLPFIISHMVAASERQGWKGTFDIKKDLLRANNFYVTVQTQDDIPYVMGFVGEDNLMIGTDYTHADGAAEIQAMNVLNKRSDLNAIQKRKILDDNPRTFYAL